MLRVFSFPSFFCGLGPLVRRGSSFENESRIFCSFLPCWADKFSSLYAPVFLKIAEAIVNFIKKYELHSILALESVCQPLSSILLLRSVSAFFNRLSFICSRVFSGAVSCVSLLDAWVSASSPIFSISTWFSETGFG